MSSIAIYMEGGGNGRDSKAALRLGMEDFLSPLKEAARVKAWRWRLVCCGGRNATFDGFRNALQNGDDAIVALLVDAEGAVMAPVRAHLQSTDRWDLKSVSDDAVHLMVQTMEAWIVADPDALAAYYGQRFRRNALPCLGIWKLSRRTTLRRLWQRRPATRRRDATTRSATPAIS
jgi:Domain of unknown function (DUF4276)